MAQQDRNTLKQYFETGKKPTEQEYANLIDSAVNNDEDKASIAEAQAGSDETKYMTPKTTRRSVETFASGAVPVATIATQGKVELATLTEVQTGLDDEKAVTPEGAKRAAEVHAPVRSVNGFTGDVELSLGNSSTDVGSTREGILKYHYGGPNSTTNIFHIKLPYRTDTDNRMFYLKASGYAFYLGEIIDIVWVGYCYKNGSAGNKLIRQYTDVSRSPTITAGQYEGSDKHIYLWIKINGTNHTTFKIDSMRVGNGTLLVEGDLQVVVSDQLEL